MENNYRCALQFYECILSSSSSDLLSKVDKTCIYVFDAFYTTSKHACVYCHPWADSVGKLH